MKKILELLMLFKKVYINLDVDQTKYGQIHLVNFTTENEIIVARQSIQPIMKKNLLLLKDLLGPRRINL